MSRRLVSLAAVFCGLTLASPALAAKPKIAFRLEYAPPTPPEGCPDPEELALLLAAEFGYLVVRTDVSPVVRIEVHRVGRGFEAELWGPGPAGGTKPWHGRTDPQGTCRELAYDVATLVEARLGARAWGSEAPPPHLAAPPEIEVNVPELHTFAFRPPESLAALVPQATASVTSSTPNGEEPPFQVEAAIGPALSLYGLPGVAVGGSGLLGVRWPLFAFFAEVRGLITPASGVGDRDLPGRTVAWTGSVLPCLALKHVDACGVVSVSQLQFDLGSGYDVTASDAFSVGFGGRVDGRIRLSERFRLHGYVDLNMQLRSIVVALDPTESRNAVTDWRSPLLRITAGITVSANLLE
ncbi:hypothetical protein [Polyangium sp. y55x31]|uniref:hypothetical protein n=1 Tax=Polyangium sp. y55x31 TaxID=3042688 RepID=UPI00248286DC|nr:hypothetical protein [Polyangium sp. y55x31]MDI1484710.1 hypothetical protein [Polyangium sp. y55x31]